MVRPCGFIFFTHGILRTHRKRVHKWDEDSAHPFPITPWDNITEKFFFDLELNQREAKENAAKPLPPPRREIRPDPENAARLGAEFLTHPIAHLTSMDESCYTGFVEMLKRCLAEDDKAKAEAEGRVANLDSEAPDIQAWSAGPVNEELQVENAENGTQVQARDPASEVPWQLLESASKTCFQFQDTDTRRDLEGMSTFVPDDDLQAQIDALMTEVSHPVTSTSTPAFSSPSVEHCPSARSSSSTTHPAYSQPQKQDVSLSFGSSALMVPPSNSSSSSAQSSLSSLQQQPGGYLTSPGIPPTSFRHTRAGHIQPQNKYDSLTTPSLSVGFLPTTLGMPSLRHAQDWAPEDVAKEWQHGPAAQQRQFIGVPQTEHEKREWKQQQEMPQWIPAMQETHLPTSTLFPGAGGESSEWLGGSGEGTLSGWNTVRNMGLDS